ncbi:MAG: DUF3987 domain-containing protein [Methanotrichaceae archaeon]
MDTNNHAPWCRDEAAGILSLMKKDYMRRFKDLLMVLYDCKAVHRKLRTSQRKSAKTDFKVDDPYLNLMWATTGAGFGANTELNDTLSGFLARFLYFFPQGKKDRWLPLEEGAAHNSDLEDVVRGQLQSIANKAIGIKESVAIHINPKATEYFNRWQKLREDQWTASNDDFDAQIYGRLAPTVIKFGLLFEFGSTDFDPAKPIRFEFIEEACRLVDSYLMPTARLAYDMVGDNVEKNVIDRIITYLKAHSGRATKRDVLRKIKVKTKDFDEYLGTMLEGGIVEIKKVKHTRGAATQYIILISEHNVSNVSNVDIVDNVPIVPEIPDNSVSDKKDDRDTRDDSDNSDKMGDITPPEDSIKADLQREEQFRTPDLTGMSTKDNHQSWSEYWPRRPEDRQDRKANSRF